MEDIAGQHPEAFVKVTAAWVTSVLERRDAQHMRDYSRAHETLQAMRSNPTPTTNHDFTYFRELVRDHVTSQFGHSDKQSYRLDNFPGPMASQMGRKDVRLLKDHEYWITEKSDGIRVMFLGMHVPKFPSWHRMDGEKCMPLPLLESCELEHHFTAKTADLLVSIGGTPHRVDFSTETATPPQAEPATEPALPIRLKRRLGFSFGYVFDRTFEIYLCLEEFPIPFADTLAQELQAGRPSFALTRLCFALVDGEYLASRADGRTTYSIYDAVSVSFVKPDNTTQHLNFFDKPMSERMAAIRRYIVEPHQQFHSHFGLPPPTSLRFVAKHFYSKAELPTVIRSIHRDAEGEYVYEDERFGKNLNDGLVFTPESSKLYCFKPGGAKSLLKWKWPDKLSVDFKVRPHDLRQSPMEVDFLFTARRAQGQVDVLYKRGPLSNSRRCEVPFDRPSICECVFNEELAMWDVLLVRTDKDFGNGFPAVSSTLENIVTNLCIADLAAELIPDSSTARPPTPHAAPSEPVHFKVDRGRDNRLYLHYFLQFPGGRSGQNPFTQWLSYVTVADCFGFEFDDFSDEHGNVPLVEHLSANLEPGTAMYVCARFHLARGRWEIFSGTGVQERCSGQELLLALERMAHCIAIAKAAPPTAAIGGSIQNGMSGFITTAVPRPIPRSATTAPDGGEQSPSKRRKLPSRNRQHAAAVATSLLPPPSDATADAPVVAAATAVDVQKQAVAEHYDKATEQAQQEEESERSSLRRFNNWVKSVLISETVVGGLDVLDLCCGRGGDLPKWKKANIRSLVGADISPVAITEATKRWTESFQDHFRGSFVCTDCFGPPFNQAIAAVRPEKGFAVVSSQFAIHYAFRSEAHVRQLLYNVTSNLKAGGIFLGTTVDDREFAKRLQAGTTNEAGNRRFGNRRYFVELMPGNADASGGLDPSRIYNVEYNFTLHGSVENCAEYLIRWSNFVQLAKGFGLVLDYQREPSSNFADFYEQYGRARAYERLFTALRADGLDAEEWEAATLYRTFVFRKR
eukprot:GGOE01001553.1.p1 GENE.GGOE01001553.1~~GGOE01001553.1.p1  ORF type:complete len:1025 (-),score=336.25 GGOE01001553.1:52-3126(-)